MKYIPLILLLLVGCDSNREEIVDRHPDGKKKILIKYKGEETLGSFYYLPDGTEFNVISYYDNGKIMSVHQMDEDRQYPNGLSLRFDRNHNIISRSNYKDGELDGEWVIYTPDGRVMSRTYWENGKKIDSN